MRVGIGRQSVKCTRPLQDAATIRSVNLTWPSFWELVLLAAGAAVLFLTLRNGWYRIDSVPRRPALASTSILATLALAMLLAAPVGYTASQHLFSITLPPPDGETVSLEQATKLMLGAAAMQFVVLVLYVYLLMQSRPPSIDTRTGPLKAIGFGVVVLLLVWPIVNLFSWLAMQVADLLRDTPVDVIAHSTLAMLVDASPDIWFISMILLAVVAAPLLEEVLYRGIVQELLGRMGMGCWSAIILTSIIFTLMHAGAVPPWAWVALFVLSLGFGWAYEKTGRLTTPIVMHMLFNAGNIAIAMLLH